MRQPLVIMYILVRYQSGVVIPCMDGTGLVTKNAILQYLQHSFRYTTHIFEILSEN